MEAYEYIILTVLICAVISAAIIWILTMKHRKEQRKWERVAQDNYTRGQDDASQLLRDTYDKIEADRNQLSILSDREILMQIMEALGSYGRRLDRVDAKLQFVTHYKTYIDDMNSKARSLTQNFIVLENDISSTASMIHKLQNTIGDTADGISTLLEEIDSMGSVHHTVTDYISQLSRIEQTLEQLHKSTAHIVEEMSTVMDTHDQSPMRKLKTIELEINGLNLLASTIQENITELSENTRNIGNSLENSREDTADISSRLKGISSTLSQLERHMETSRNSDK